MQRFSPACTLAPNAVNKEANAIEGRRRAKILCVLAVALVLVATLWPMNPFPANGAVWLKGTPGLKFSKTALVTSTEPFKPPETNAAESYTLEFLIRPASIDSSSTVLGVYDPTSSKQLLVRQWFDRLLVTHDARVRNDHTGTISFEVEHVFHLGRLVFFAVSSGPGGTTVFVDGQQAQVFPRFRISRVELSGEIVLGTSPVAYQPWSGELRGLAIYAKKLTAEEVLRHYESWVEGNASPPDRNAAIACYTFAERSGSVIHSQVAFAPNLEIPPTFSVPYKPFLQTPRQEFRLDWRYALDVASNIAGFVPLGLIVCSYLEWTHGRWKALFLTLAFCGMLSFAIEVLQYYIPKRGSGVTDIITNTLGAALGAGLVQTVAVRRRLDQLKLASLYRLFAPK